MKLVIDIPDDEYAEVKALRYPVLLEKAVQDGIPLDDIDSDETRAYFDGEAFGWDEGREALIDDLKAEIKSMEYHMIDCEVLVSQEEVLHIIEKYMAESEETE